MNKEKVQEYAAKVVRHVEAAARHQAVVEKHEREALETAKADARGRAQSRRAQATPPEYRAKILLQENFWYKVAVGNRDAHEAQAKLAAAAMAAWKELD